MKLSGLRLVSHAARELNRALCLGGGGRGGGEGSGGDGAGERASFPVPGTCDQVGVSRPHRNAPFRRRLAGEKSAVVRFHVPFPMYFDFLLSSPLRSFQAPTTADQPFFNDSPVGRRRQRVFFWGGDEACFCVCLWRGPFCIQTSAHCLGASDIFV